MRIRHRFEFPTYDEVLFFLAETGIERNGYAHAYEIWEDDSDWERKFRVAVEARGIETVSTEYSPEDLSEAEWLAMLPGWNCGDPMPFESMAFQHVTYDHLDHCCNCGVGLIQRGPFKMRREPRWGPRSLAHLYGVNDEHFTTPSVHAELFARFGIGAREVVLFPQGTVLQTVVQLVTDEIVKIETARLTYLDCSVCGTRRYEHQCRGFQPPVLGSPNGHIVKSDVMFGGGSVAGRMVFISGELYGEICLRNLSGAGFKPCG